MRRRGDRAAAPAVSFRRAALLSAVAAYAAGVAPLLA